MPTSEPVDLLDEEPSPIRRLLWSLAHPVIEWAGAAPERRGSLFAGCAPSMYRDLLGQATVPFQVEWAIRQLICVVATPGSGQPEIVSVAVKIVSQWAETRRCGLTALWFAHASVLADPLRAQHAADAGHIALRMGRRAQGEAWLRRALALARRSGKEQFAYAAALLGLGDTFRDRGHFDEARRHYAKACRYCHHQGLHQEHRTGRIRLVRLGLTTGKYTETLNLCCQILGSLTRDDPEYIPCAIDRAEVKLRLGNEKAALADLRRLLLDPGARAERARIASLLARAAAMLEDRRTFTAAWEATEQALAEVSVDRATGWIVLELAASADQIGLRRQAVETAERAASIAAAARDDVLATRARAVGQPHHTP